MISLASVIIANWNGAPHLTTCLNSLRRQTYKQLEVIFVDNGSSDDSLAIVRDQFPEVKVVALDTNRGFTGANNAGFAVASGSIVFLLNNDTEADPAWVHAIMSAFAARPDAGIVASKILLFDRRDHFHAAGDGYRVNGLPLNRGVWQQDRGQYDRREEVFSACGAAIGIRRVLIDEIGFLDDRLFFSFEDVDLAWRAHLAGWRVIYEPTAVVYHKLKASGGSGVMGSYFDGRNRLLVLYKNVPSSLLRRYWRAIVRAQLMLAMEALRAWRGAAARAHLRGQLVGLLTLWRVWPERRRLQANRRSTDEELMAYLWPVDDSIGGG